MKFSCLKGVIVLFMMLSLFGCSSKNEYAEEIDSEVEEEVEDERYKTREEKEAAVSNALGNTSISVSKLTDEQLDAFVCVIDYDGNIKYNNVSYYVFGTSRSEIRKELENQGFTADEADYVVDNLDLEWEAFAAAILNNALKKNTPVEYVISDLEADGFTQSEIEAAILANRDAINKHLDSRKPGMPDEPTW